MKGVLKVATAISLICASLFTAIVIPLDEEVTVYGPCPIPDPNDPRCGFYD